MKKILYALLLVLCISCSQKIESSSEIQSIVIGHSDISIDEFNSSFAQPDSNTIILDVRTDREYDAGNIPNSIQIDFMSPDFKDNVVQLDSTKTYVVYCQSGGRSTAASKIMTKELGFKDVSNLVGGYSVWSKKSE